MTLFRVCVMLVVWLIDDTWKMFLSDDFVNILND